MRFQIHTGKAELREVKLLAKGKQLVRDSGIPHLPGAGLLHIECILHIECSTFHSIIFQDLE